MPLFSIVIATVNRAALLERCLESVLAQDFDDYEVIVVDGGSTDATDAVLARAPRVRVIKERGGGPGGARNLGAQAATGRFLVFVDSDDIIRHSSLTVYSSVLQDVPAAKMLLAAFTPFTDAAGDDVFATDATPIRHQSYADYLRAAERGHLSGTHRLVIDRGVFLDAGGLAPALRVCEDQDFGLRVNDVGPCVVILSPATIGYRQHGGNISSGARDFGEGVRWMIDAERAGRYPGGADRAPLRRRIITRTARSASMACLEQGLATDGLRIYADSIGWNARQGRWKYLIGFPIKAASAQFAADVRNAG